MINTATGAPVIIRITAINCRDIMRSDCQVVYGEEKQSTVIMPRFPGLATIFESDGASSCIRSNIGCKVTDWPNTEVPVEDEKNVTVLTGLTVWVTTALVLPLSLSSPL